MRTTYGNSRLARQSRICLGWTKILLQASSSSPAVWVTYIIDISLVVITLSSKSFALTPTDRSYQEFSRFQQEDLDVPLPAVILPATIYLSPDRALI